MQLETIEEKALNYLGQISNPLVRIDVLHVHLTDPGAGEQILLSDLEVFFTHHELIRVIKPLAQEAGVATEEVASGDGAGPRSYVILDTRVPTEQQTTAMMLDQLNSLHEALSIAQAHAKTQALDTADFSRLGEIDDALGRVQGLREKLTASVNPPASTS